MIQYQLYYSGFKGDIAASLYYGEDLVDKATGLRSARAAERWGKGAAGLHKNSTKQADSNDHKVSINGHKHFTL